MKIPPRQSLTALLLAVVDFIYETFNPPCEIEHKDIKDSRTIKAIPDALKNNDNK